VNGEAFEGSETFTIPKVTNDTVVKVTFRWKNVFSDVKNDDWFYESVMFANKNGLMKGTSDTEFEPESAVTRGMFVTVLYRMEKEPVTDLARFTDVKPDDYFAKAVGWAKENNIVNGATATEFAPNENVTREQMAAIIYRYATQKGIDVTSAKATYADATEISEYATDAIDFCTAKQILQGKGDNVFAPKDDATRAEIAAVFMRMVGKLK
ncbi:MAG: S-layer homology domain-containing protein, partial [Oscillospiraceae bacterium]